MRVPCRLLSYEFPKSLQKRLHSSRLSFSSDCSMNRATTSALRRLNVNLPQLNFRSRVACWSASPSSASSSGSFQVGTRNSSFSDHQTVKEFVLLSWLEPHTSTGT